MTVKIIEANITVSVQREGKSLSVKKGEPFDFTDEELGDIARAFGEDAVREPKDEVAVAKVAAKPVTKAATKKADESL